MCRTAEDIRHSDYTCIALDEYIQHRKKSVNGDKESLAYFDVLRAEAQIQNRIVTLQTQEDMLEKFKKTQTELVKISQTATGCKTEIKAVDEKLDIHIAECEKNPTLKKMMATEPKKVLIHFTWISLVYFILFHIAYEWVGLTGIIKGLLNHIPGIEIP